MGGEGMQGRRDICMAWGKGAEGPEDEFSTMGSEAEEGLGGSRLWRRRLRRGAWALDANMGR